MARQFVASDTHFGHENIIRYANRPFGDWRRMGEAMIERWNSRVADGDDVWFLGDFAMGPGATPDYVVSVLNRLNGRIRVVLGNHDLPSKYSKGFLNLVLANNLHEKILILDAQITTDVIDGVKFVMCHYPMADWDGKYHGAIHLHGHTHTQFKPKEAHDMKQARRYDIGVDMYGGPVQVTGDLRYLNDPKGWN